jgi:hypothetical protein
VKAVPDGAPFGGSGRGFDGDPVPGLLVEFVEEAVEAGGAFGGVFRKRQRLASGGGFGPIEKHAAAVGREGVLVGEGEGRLRAVVAPMLAGGLLRRAGGCFGGEENRADDIFDLFPGDDSGAEEQGLRAGEGKDGAFDSDFTGSAIEDEGDGRPEGVADMSGGCGGEAGEGVRAGRGDGEAGLAEQGEGDGMTGHAETHGGQAGGDAIADRGTFGDDEGKGAGPEAAGELFGCGGPEEGERAGHGQIGDVDDEGTGRRAALGGEDELDGGGVEGVGAEAVDGFGGEGDELAGAEEGDGLRDELRVHAVTGRASRGVLPWRRRRFCRFCARRARRG